MTKHHRETEKERVVTGLCPVQTTMAKSRKVFAVHPGEILKFEFMEPLGLSGYALGFPGIYEVVRGDRAISAETAIRLGKYFGLPAQFWLNLQNDRSENRRG